MPYPYDQTFFIIPDSSPLVKAMSKDFIEFLAIAMISIDFV
jgi:hypothetical protein